MRNREALLIWPLAGGGGLAVAFGLFVVMQALISNERQDPPEPAPELQRLAIMEDPPEPESQEQEREEPPPEPDPPEQPETPSPSPEQPSPSATPQAAMENSMPQASLDSEMQFPGAPGRAGAGEPVAASSLNATRRLPPRYPSDARMRRQEGFVKLAFTVTKNGGVTDVEVVEAQPEGVFERAAVQALKGWRFEPVKRDGEATTVRAVQTLNFSLDQ